MTTVGEEALASAAFERIAPDLQALRQDELAQVSLDITAAVATVLGTLPEVRALRDQIAKELPAFDITQVDRLEDFALGLSHAHAKYLSATQPPDDLEPLSAEAIKLRERFLAEARTFTHHGVISDAQLENLKGANGKKNVATDLMVLTGLLQANWQKIAGKTPTTPEDLEHGSRVATRLLRIIGLREQGPASVAEATDQRLRAYSKLLAAYEDVQRAVTYLRGNRYDADSIVPNLHPGRPGTRRKQEEPPAVPPGTVAAPNASSGAPAATSGAASGTVPVAAPATAPGAGPSGPFMPATASRG